MGPTLQERIATEFAYEHLKSEAAKAVSKHFHDLALFIADNTPPGRFQAIAITDLWTAKNAAVASLFQPKA